jgi:hypothetical protein
MFSTFSNPTQVRSFSRRLGAVLALVVAAFALSAAVTTRVASADVVQPDGATASVGVSCDYFGSIHYSTFYNGNRSTYAMIWVYDYSLGQWSHLDWTNLNGGMVIGEYAPRGINFDDKRYFAIYIQYAQWNGYQWVMSGEYANPDGEFAAGGAWCLL